MASYVVDGLVLPMRVGGHPALDFCNTRAAWGAPTPKEYLHTYAHLARWSQDCGLVSDGLPARAAAGPAAAGPAAAVLVRAIELRSCLYAVLVGGGGAAAWSGVCDEVRAAVSTATLAPDAGPAPARWDLRPGLELPLTAIAWSVAELLTSPAARSVRACPGEGCGWVFADPRGRRRWCSMAWCGNRAKARRHAERLSDR